MLKKEFEKLYGSTVMDSVYDLIEDLYMDPDNHLDKVEFVKHVKKNNLVQNAYEHLLSQAEVTLIEIKLKMHKIYTQNDNVFKNTKCINTLDVQYAPDTMISASVKDIHIHNQNLLALATCNTANIIFEIIGE